MRILRKGIKVVAKVWCVWLVCLLVISLAYQIKRYDHTSDEIENPVQVTDENVPTVGTEGKEVDVWMK